MVEIGALRGDTTVRLLDLLGPESELHVIDPLPNFDPEEHERRFPGRYIFHRDISHNVLPDLPAGRRGADRRRPQLVHGLPRAPHAAETAARRRPPDAAAASCTTSAGPTAGGTSTTQPNRIPEEFRQPYARRGLRARPARPARAGWAEPAPGQRRRGGRTAQRRDDGARRLRRRVRGRVARRRASALLRPRDRRAAKSCSRNARSSARCSTGSRAPRAGTS